MDAIKPKVLLGVTGCIAAYKACEIVRGLQKVDIDVKVIMTEHAAHFINPVTFRALTHEKVALDLFDDPTDPIHHISLAQECDLFLVAPCTANMIAKLATGIADDLMSTVALATDAPIMVAPAMNVHMYQAKATCENLDILRRRGVTIIEPEEGYLACGEVGAGRLADPTQIVESVREQLFPVRDLTGKRILITAGPTIEPIDEVRYISNHSSGKMGYALARIAARRGAAVTLISGPTSLSNPEGVDTIRVTTAEEMLSATKVVFPDIDIALFAAAVADGKPIHCYERKLKKGIDDEVLFDIKLEPTPDILGTLAHAKAPHQIIVGFAAETDDVIDNAKKKLISKNADMIVANRVGSGLAFGQDDNEACLITETETVALPKMSKEDLADKIFDVILK